MKSTYITGLLCLASSLIILSCGNKEKKAEEIPIVAMAESPLYPADTSLALLRLQCYSCHQTNSSSEQNIIAPPMAAVKLKYLQAFPEKQVFIDSMVAFVKNPTKASAKMPGAVARFNLMPRIYTEDRTLKSIVAYMYDQKLEEPSWFKGQAEKE